MQQLLFRLLAFAMVAAVHGCAQAAAAGWLGDRGPTYDGRRSLDPFVQVDPVGAICGVLFGYGWIRSVALERGLLRGRGLGLVLVALAGLVAVAALALAAEALRGPLIGGASGNLTIYGVVFLQVLATQALAFVVINLLPLPPFTGGLFLSAVVPGVAAAAARYRFAIGLAAAALIVAGVADWLLLPVLRPLSRWLLGA